METEHRTTAEPNFRTAAQAEWPPRGSIVGYTDELNQGAAQLSRAFFYVCACINNALTTRHPVPVAAYLPDRHPSLPGL
jgi:hypothetical protein